MRLKPLAGTYAPSAVTAPLQHIELSREITTPKTTLDPRIVPDAKWPGMYRINLPGGGLSDLINLTRARDALRQLF